MMAPPMTRPARLCAFLVLVAAALSGPPALADRRDDAKKHFAAGKKHHDASEWDAAVAEYLAAYQLDPNPAFLFNLGQVYRLKGDRAKAVEYYGRYLEAAPSAKGSDEARTYATKLKAELDAEAAAAREKAEAEARRAAEEAQQAAQRERAAEEAQRQKLEAERVDAERARAAAAAQRQGAERKLRIAGIASAAAGAVAIGLGVKFGLDAQSREREVSNPPMNQWTTQLDQAVDDGQTKALAMGVCVALGGVLVAAGGVLLGLGWPSRESKVTASAGPGGARASVGWEF
jgi:membrane protein involved in colicin uptake